MQIVMAEKAQALYNEAYENWENYEFDVYYDEFIEVQSSTDNVFYFDNSSYGTIGGFIEMHDAAWSLEGSNVYIVDLTAGNDNDAVPVLLIGADTDEQAAEVMQGILCGVTEVTREAKIKELADKIRRLSKEMTDLIEEQEKDNA